VRECDVTSWKPAKVFLAVSGLLATAHLSASAIEQRSTLQAVRVPRTTLQLAAPLVLPGTVDSNSPAVWDLEAGRNTLFVMTSYAGQPHLASGASVTQLGTAQSVSSQPDHGIWMEAVVTDDAGTWYGYYHNEIAAIACGRPDRFVPRIGAARSVDHGRTWQDLGIILEAPPDSVACASSNRYVIGGVGDLSVMLNADKTDLYFFFSQYENTMAQQGVAVGRLLWANRDRPIGRVSVWNDGIWQYGRVSRSLIVTPDGMSRRLWFAYPVGTPLVPTTEAWHDDDNKVNAFWGPSVHWNTYLEQYVMLLNRAADESYTQDGIYVSFAPQLDDPRLWSPPQKILNGGKWYPQVMGLTVGAGTDKVADATARLFISGRSDFAITFER
jgi:hypothetical protein